MINPEQRTITPFEPSSDVCETLRVSIEAIRPPYLGTIDVGGDGVFLSDGAYCVEDPYGAWEPPQKPWFEMDFRGPDGGPGEHRRLVGNCIVLGYDYGRPDRLDYNLCDATITAEELAERVHWHSPASQTAAQQTAAQTTIM
jgi:hypothetical protein